MILRPKESTKRFMISRDSRFGDLKIPSSITEPRGANGAISSEFQVTRCNSVGPKQVGLMATTTGKIRGMYNGSADNLREMNGPRMLSEKKLPPVKRIHACGIMIITRAYFRADYPCRFE